MQTRTGYDNQMGNNDAGAREKVAVLRRAKVWDLVFQLPGLWAIYQRNVIECKHQIEKDETDDRSDNQNWKHIICTMHNFKRLLQLQLTILTKL
ncbi:hypothetical protein Tco_1516616 [Tanacetum coccineum]